MAPPRLEDFPVHATDTLRYADTDRQGHVNNAVHSVFMETGRVGFLYDPAREMPPAGFEFVLARLCIDYLAELHWPGSVMIGTRVARLGGSSLEIEQAVFTEGRPVSRGQSVCVLIDTQTRRAAPLPEPTRALLERLTGG